MCDDFSEEKKYNTYTLDTHILITYDPNIKHEIYSCQWYHGIIFHISENEKYDVIHNIYMGNRLLTNKESYWSDIPFKKETFKFLPPGVEAIEI